VLSRRMSRVGVLAAVVAGVVGVWLLPSPASAQSLPDYPPVGEDGDDIVGQVETQVDMLNSGSAGSGGPPPTCPWTQLGAGPNGEDVERTDGTPRWREPGQGHDFWADGWEQSEGQEVGDGLIFRYECWHPEMGCRTPAPSGAGCLGEDIQDTFCGSFLCLFDAVNPPNLARLLVDGFVENLGPPVAAFSPADRTLVNFDTYMWLTNAPADGVVGPWSMSVPGLTVTAWATASDITWDMGDGTTLTCPVTRDEASAAAAPCSHVYQVSSVRQPGERYAGNVSMTFEVGWQATGAGSASGSLDALRSNPFTLAVAEAQAINTGD
jgi:hypothetical protein